MSTDSLGDRMKQAEHVFRHELPRRMPLLLRVDGVCFHSFCKHMKRPFDERLMDVMDDAAMALCKRISGAQIAYVQSDEITVLIHGYKRLDSQLWFNGEIQKIASVAAAIPSSVVSRAYGQEALFDARVWVLPEAEVCNLFLWRQQDATRNSLSMVTHAHYSHKECHGKNSAAKHEMLYAKGINWNNLPTYQKRGRCVVRHPVTRKNAVRAEWVVDREIPIFSENRNYIERHLAVEAE
jgi:tRNA(His) 5'-end guanylyltransferase